MRREGTESMVAVTKGEEKEKQERKRAKGGPFVGGYRENEARHRVPHGPFSRHGARRDGDRNSAGPRSRGPAAVPGPCS